MGCIVCETQQRDVNDVQHRIAELAIDQRRALDPDEKDYIGLEMRALETARRELEGKHLKHKNSIRHLG